jgi:hypothetical protein
LKDPIMESIHITRQLLEVPYDAKVLLCVDELAKCGEKENDEEGPGVDARIRMFLTSLTSALDSDPQLFLSVSVYGIIDLATLTTSSKRPLLLQSLPPIFVTVPLDEIKLLPPVLKVFMDETKRKQLPFRPEDLEQYAKLSNLVVQAGGHPRRLATLMFWLRKFSFTNQPLTRNLKSFFEANDILYQMNFVAKFPTVFHRDIESESLARDAACKFTFPTLSDDIDAHRSVLVGCSKGYCSFLESKHGLGGGHAFIPMPVLRLFVEESQGPIGSAAGLLYTSLNSFCGVSAKEYIGKAWEGVTAAAVLMFARSNAHFSPSIWCARGQFGSDLEQNLRGGPEVEYVTVETLGWRETTSEDKVKAMLRPHLERFVNSKCPGVVIVPKNPLNPGLDVCAIFQCNRKTEDGSLELVVLAMQCKDWFRDNIQGSSIQAEWSGCKPDLMKPLLFAIDGKDVRVHVQYLLFSTNDLENEVQCGDDGGVVTVTSMRNWLPTASYACQGAHHLRRVFCETEKKSN